MLCIGLQFAIWAVSGVYMVYFDIHYIHGDSLVKNKQQVIEAKTFALTFTDVINQFPKAEQLRLGQLLSTPVYRFVLEGKQHLLEAHSGKLIDGVDESKAKLIALTEFTGGSEIENISLITDNPPFELSARRLPAWRVDFKGVGAPTLYISSLSGEVVTKRHSFWRIFDWMWRLHIMDYDDGADIDNIFLSVIGVLALLATMSGLILTYHHVLRARIRRITKQRKVIDNHPKKALL